MKPDTSFSMWLKDHTNEPSEVGDLARTAMNNPDFPTNSHRYRSARLSLGLQLKRDRAACEVLSIAFFRYADDLTHGWRPKQ